MNAPASSTYAVARLFASLGLMACAGSAMYAAIMALEPAAAEFDTGRGGGSMPYTLFMIGFGLGGIAMGRLGDRFGAMVPQVIGAFSIALGFSVAASAETLWEFGAALGLLCGLFGASATFAPLVADVSHWFGPRRGLAVGIVISGSYVAGAVWPPLLQHFFDTIGWRATFDGLSIFVLCSMLPLSAVLWRRAPIDHAGEAEATHGNPRRPLGFSPFGLQGLLCCAGIACCAAMAMPQVHIVPFATDMGFSAARGAEMLSLMLGFGIVSRLGSGWLSDRIGGLKTLMLGSALQGAVLFAYMFVTTLTELYVLAICFGLSQGGIVPSYAIIIRRFFAPRDAGWRIGTTLMCTIGGMALGGWLAGLLYDLFGHYGVSFLVAIAFNVFNLAVAAWLFARSRTPARVFGALAPATPAG